MRSKSEKLCQPLSNLKWAVTNCISFFQPWLKVSTHLILKSWISYKLITIRLFRFYVFEGLVCYFSFSKEIAIATWRTFLLVQLYDAAVRANSKAVWGCRPWRVAKIPACLSIQNQSKHCRLSLHSISTFSIMHTVWVRLNAVVFFGLTVLLGLSCMAGISKIGHASKHQPSKSSRRMKCTITWLF